MDWLLYVVALGLVTLLQALPLRAVARLGRVLGAVAYCLDLRHRRVALRNLTQCLGRELSLAEIRALAREHFRRLGENYCCAVKTAAMTWDELKRFVEFRGAEHVLPDGDAQPPRTVVVAIGHFGNFELYARFGQFVPAIRCATTYRGLSQPSLNRLLQSMREKSGCVYFERRTDAAALKAWMAPTGLMLGLLADQHAGSGGMRVPFFDHDCSTTVSPAVFALRYGCALHTAVCYRVGLAQWRVELGQAIPTREGDKARRVEAITLDVNHAFEAAVRRDPANWFWVHNRWKPNKTKQPRSTSTPQSPEPAYKP
jgi:KDO2-lipid IV(A) lauroyltransferase